MHILNDGKYAFVFPPRCGTRWIAAELYDRGMLSTKGPHHRYMEVQGNIQNQLMKKEEMLARQQREQRAEAIRAKYNLPKNS